MGRGNVLPSSVGEFEMVYVEYPEYEDSFQAELWHQDLKAELESNLPKDFAKPYKDTWIGRSDHVIFESNYTTVRLIDNENSMAVVFAPKTNEIRGIVYKEYKRVAKRMFGKLKELYELRVRTSAWTSAPYDQELSSMPAARLKESTTSATV